MRHDAREARGTAGRRQCARAARSIARFTLAAAVVSASAVATKVALRASQSRAEPAAKGAAPFVAMTNVATRDTNSRDSHARGGALAGGRASVRYFGGRPVRPVRTARMRVTAYSPDAQSCGKWADGITASGKSVWTNAGKLVAADTSMLPLGSLVSVPGYDEGAVVPVLDRGGAIKGNRLDVLYPTHERALQWGVQDLDVIIWEYADEADAS